jgi:hypothetical protein
MARIGSVPAAPILGDQFASLYLGATRVPTVPGKPVIVSASADSVFRFNDPANDGGSEITARKVFVDGDEVTPDELEANPDGSPIADFGVALAESAPGSSVQVSAVNAVGEGPRSAPFVLPAE